jgi:hypothetical protein
MFDDTAYVHVNEGGEFDASSGAFNAFLASLDCPWPDTDGPTQSDSQTLSGDFPSPIVVPCAMPQAPIPQSVPLAEAVTRLGEAAFARVKRGGALARHIINLQLAFLELVEIGG